MSYAGAAPRSKRAPQSPRNRPDNPRPPGTKTSAASQRPRDEVTADGRPLTVFAAGVLVGIAAGAGVALFLAPYDGADTRRALGRQRRRLGQHGHDAWDDLRAEFRRAMRQRRRARARKREEARGLNSDSSGAVLS